MNDNFEVHDRQALSQAKAILNQSESPREWAKAVIEAVQRNEDWRGKRCINLLAPEAPTSPTVRALLSAEIGTRAAEGHIGRVNRWFAGTQYIDEVEAPKLVESTSRVSWFVYVVRFEPGIDRDRIAAHLGEQGIPARPYFIPIHLQPYMVERFGYRAGDYPVTEDLGQRGLALPFSSVMTQAQVHTVCEALKVSL